MLRKDREITDIDRIYDILTRCDTISIGLRGDEHPYVVPLSFGAELRGGELTIYFHGARRGQKIDMIERGPHVCVQAHIFHGAERTQGSITARYESVIGFGIAERVLGDEAAAGLRSIAAHYGYHDYDIKGCAELPMTAVYRIALSGVTGKSNLL